MRIHGEMVLLENYSSLNFMGQSHNLLPLPSSSFLLFLLFLVSPGLVKILKKHDKRTGGLLLQPFIQRALRQPFFTTEPLARLVRESEASLELLFPHEPEVVDGAPGKDQPPGSVQSDSADLLRGTLAAMRAIQGMRKASSTSSPLSLGQFFPESAGSGDLTAENSLSHDSDSDSDPSAGNAGL